MVDGLLGDANGVEPAPGRVKDSGKWQKPRFSRKALMKCCLVKWIIASTQPQDKGEGFWGGEADVFAGADDAINARVLEVTAKLNGPELSRPPVGESDPLIRGGGSGTQR